MPECKNNLKAGIFIFAVVLSVFSCTSKPSGEQTAQNPEMPSNVDSSETITENIPLKADTIDLKEIDSTEVSLTDSIPPPSPQPRQDTDEDVTHPFIFPYRLNQPNETYELPMRLTEISAISFDEKGELGCVQDEKGNIYMYNLQTREVDEKIDFGKDGDYEGLAFVGKSAYVLRGDGNIYRVKHYGKKKQETKKYKTFLSEVNDAEGLCYDSRHNRLLVALKGKAGKGKEFNNKKAVYEFDLEDKELKEKPVYVIDLDEVAKKLKSDKISSAYRQMAEFFDPSKGNRIFQPSEIAVHPISNNIYISASVGKILMVLNRRGEVVHLESLDKQILKQPEGLAFYKNGDLLISTEGKGGRGKIFKFHYTL